MTKRGHHTSIYTDLKPVVKWLDSIPEVKRVIMGKTIRVSHSRPSGYFNVRSSKPGGIVINAYGSRGITEIFLKTDKSEEVMIQIQDRNK